MEDEKKGFEHRHSAGALRWAAAGDGVGGRINYGFCVLEGRGGGGHHRGDNSGGYL